MKILSQLEKTIDSKEIQLYDDLMINFFKAVKQRLYPTCPISHREKGPYEYIQLEGNRIGNKLEVPLSCLQFLEIVQYTRYKRNSNTVFISRDEMERILKHKHTVVHEKGNQEKIGW